MTEEARIRLTSETGQVEGSFKKIETILNNYQKQLTDAAEKGFNVSRREYRKLTDIIADYGKQSKNNKR